MSRAGPEPDYPLRNPVIIQRQRILLSRLDLLSVQPVMIIAILTISGSVLLIPRRASFDFSDTLAPSMNHHIQ